ncbi:hypothetical protein DEO23_10185 [Brachybacterium endophyticum]|uniref:Uncharacterized protein n=1 Tax=Brachybacterium endophyticum TaxID=2182385 RepID=A0A2U2RK01_9MICO|nr:hypothetical protein DEO23_10185 [Brachybacterium endophyticum]
MRLCTVQGSYRARLTPKPWRVGRAALSVRWPAEGPAQAKYESWVRSYESALGRAAACRRVWWNGVGPATDGERQVLALHDELSGSDTGSALA